MSILVDDPVNPGERAAVASLLQSLSNGQGELASDEGRFWIDTGHPIGAAWVGEGRPFSLHYQSPPELFREPGAAASWVSTLGSLPREEVLLVAYCNGPADHLLLASLALVLARRLNGLIDLGGTLEDALGWAEHDPRGPALHGSLPGACHAITYLIDSDRCAATHVVDAAFLAAWIAHPLFRLVG